MISCTDAMSYRCELRHAPAWLHAVGPSISCSSDMLLGWLYLHPFTRSRQSSEARGCEDTVVCCAGAYIVLQIQLAEKAVWQVRKAEADTVVTDPAAGVDSHDGLQDGPGRETES